MTQVPTISFCDFWPGHIPLEDSVVARFANGFAPTSDISRADLVVASVYSNRHAAARGTTVSISYEPYWSRFGPQWTVDWRYLDRESHCRLPYWAVTLQDQVDLSQGILDRAVPAERKFCNFIYFNHGDPIRTEFFDKLTVQKHVDALGRIRQNATDHRLPGRYESGAMESKRLVQSDYRFTIAFENSQHDGYTTEKIVDAWLSDTIPIYWGNQLIDMEFATGSYLSLSEAGSVSNLVDMVLEVDASPALYEMYRAANPLRTGAAQRRARAHFDALDDFIPRVLADATIHSGTPRRGRVASSVLVSQAAMSTATQRIVSRVKRVRGRDRTRQ